MSLSIFCDTCLLGALQRQTNGLDDDEEEEDDDDNDDDDYYYYDDDDAGDDDDHYYYDYYYYDYYYYDDDDAGDDDDDDDVTTTVRHECQYWILPGLGCAKGAIERWNAMARDCPGATAWEFENTNTYYEHVCGVVVVVVGGGGGGGGGGSFKLYMEWCNTALCSHLYCVVMLWRWKAAVSSPGFPPSPGFPEASPAKEKSLVASELMICVAFPCPMSRHIMPSNLEEFLLRFDE